MNEINIDELDTIYRSIPKVITEETEPIPVHRQIAGHSKWVQIVNTISLAREIIKKHKNKESERYIWAQTILDRLDH